MKEKKEQTLERLVTVKFGVRQIETGMACHRICILFPQSGEAAFCSEHEHENHIWVLEELIKQRSRLMRAEQRHTIKRQVIPFLNNLKNTTGSQGVASSNRKYLILKNMNLYNSLQMGSKIKGKKAIKPGIVCFFRSVENWFFPLIL